MNNNIFSISRFSKLLKKEFHEYFQRFGTTILVFLSIIVIAWGISLLFDDGGFEPHIRRTGIYILTVLISLCSPFILYGYANHSKKGIYYALLPASSFEKFLSMALYTLLFTPIIFALAAFSLDTLLVIIKSPSWSVNILSDFFSAEALRRYGNLTQSLSLFIFANMIFKRQKVAKSVLSLFAICIFIGVIFGKIVDIYGVEILLRAKSDIMDISTFDETLFLDNNILKEVFKPWFYYTSKILAIAIPVGALTGTFFKIKTQKY